MSKLKSLLTKFYKREGNQIVFSNGLNLNQLSMLMWEKLNFEGMDASILSKVINGKRLFTPRQLSIFCDILNLSVKEKSLLITSLQQNQLENKKWIKNQILHVPYEAYFKEDLINRIKKFHFQGKPLETEELTKIALNYLGCFSIDIIQENSFYREFLKEALYFRGRSRASLSSSKNVISETLPFVQRLLKLADINNDSQAFAYANLLLADIYYLAGGYSFSKEKYFFYKKCIYHAKKALDNLPVESSEYFFALRTIIVGFGYLNDFSSIDYLRKQALEDLKRQPESNFVSSLHLFSTLDRYSIKNNLNSEFKFTNIAKDYFKKNINGHGVYEMSILKTKLEILNINDSLTKTEMPNIKRGFFLSSEYKLPRHLDFFKKIEQKLL